MEENLNIETEVSLVADTDGNLDPSQGQEVDVTDSKKFKLVSRIFGKSENKNSNSDVITANEVITGEALISVGKNAHEYNMGHPHRGKAVIFSHKNYDERLHGVKFREGTDVDRDNLAQTLKKLDFEVETYDDLKAYQLMQKLTELSADDHSNRDCLVIAVFSHGITNEIFAYDSKYDQNELWDPFTAERCPSLAGKPKIFFIQACQGDQVDHGITASQQMYSPTDSSETETDSAEAADKYTIPNRADFFMTFSSFPGYYSWRNTGKGSWFIQSICKIFNEHGQVKELQSLITHVSRDVALNFESNSTKLMWDKKKQVPYTTSTLIREVYFRHKSSVAGECLGRIEAKHVIDIEPDFNQIRSTTTGASLKKSGFKVLSFLKPNKK